MIAHQNALVRVPDGLNPVDVAPLLCSGVAIFNALRTSRARGGDVVAVCGFDSFGLLVLLFARRMRFQTVLVGRGRAHARTTTALGASKYVDGDIEDAAVFLRGLGGAAAIVATSSSKPLASAVVGGLRPDGDLFVVGPDAYEDLHLASPAELSDVLEFSVAKNNSSLPRNDFIGRGRQCLLACHAHCNALLRHRTEPESTTAERRLGILALYS
jgi:D-arabinose 1-dehydrogenase-like Zn-dependent alcohol dehydrogenase